MTTIIQGTQIRDITLGRKIEKATGTLTVATIPLFNVTGFVAITSLFGVVTTAITAAGATLLVQHDPTAGTTRPFCTVSADIGTTDTAVGEIFVPKLGSALTVGALDLANTYPFVVSAGEIELVVGTAADGAMTWHCTYVPISNDGLVVAA